MGVIRFICGILSIYTILFGVCMMKSREKFVRLAEQRVNKTIKMLELIGNLSNRSNYSYSEEDVRKILRVLQQKLKELEARFEYSNGSNKKDDFRL